MSFTIGSLFDGSGGFPLAASMVGGMPVWASEIEPYPIAVTRSRFPNMKHLGDISKINGAEIEPVDVITFGSPCQDLSVAGKRAGLKHESNGDDETTRSGLFMEAVRIIKEMRAKTNGRYPTYAVWENVPGAFSSNGGEDFRTVLEELIKIVEPRAVMPAVPKNGWAYADCYVGDGWSLAYRVFDAQYWGVPQRRRRIHLVLDLRGGRAAKILFEREGVRGYFETGRTPWQGTAADAQRSVGTDDSERNRCNCLTPWDAQSKRIYTADGVFPPLFAGETAGQNQQSVCYTIADGQVGVCIPIHDKATRYKGGGPTRNGDEDIVPTLTVDRCNCLTPWDAQSKRIYATDGVFATLPAGETSGQNQQAVLIAKCEYEADGYCKKIRGDALPFLPYCKKCYDARGNGDGIVVPTLTGDHENRVTDYTAVVCEQQPVFCLQGNGIDRADTAGCNGKGWKENQCYTPNTIDRPAVAYAMQAFGKYQESDQASSLKARDYKDATDLVVEKETPVVLDRAFYNQGVNAQYDPQLYTDGTCPTLVAKGPSAVCHKVNVRYIVRRLTPTECARLQGFPDRWGHPDPKDDFADEEYAFWLDVRNTHAAINGKAVKKYTKDQMVKWYNKLHTDSAEYKMWGNGIALPPTLYVMQGIADEFAKGRK